MFLHENWKQLHDWHDRRSGTTLFCIHTTGSTIVQQAIEAHRDPNLAVPEHYDDPHADGPNEVLCWDLYAEHPWASPARPAPDSWQIAQPMDAAPAQGTGARTIQLYKAGLPTWTRYLWEDQDGDKQKELVEYPTARDRYKYWSERHPTLASPLDLLPSGVTNPNDVTYSFELVQPIARRGAGWTTVPFTPRQHDVAGWRVAERMLYFNVPYSRQTAPRIVLGHGDFNPIARYAGYGEWDPGAACAPQWKHWDWALFFERLDYWAGCMVPSSPNPASGPGEHQ